MFKIYKENKQFGKKTFADYEAARSHLRMHLRKSADKLFNTNSMFYDAGWMEHSNPSISLYKFTIRNTNR